MSNEKKKKSFPQSTWQIARIVVITALFVAFSLALYLIRRQPTTAPTTTLVSLPAVVTPVVYQDFIGPVTGVQDNDLMVQMTINRAGGRSEHRTYRVSVSASTEIAVWDDDPTGAKITPASLTDISVGDLVGVFGDQDLGPLTAFTAIKIYKIMSS